MECRKARHTCEESGASGEGVGGGGGEVARAIVMLKVGADCCALRSGHAAIPPLLSLEQLRVSECVVVPCAFLVDCVQPNANYGTTDYSCDFTL